MDLTLDYNIELFPLVNGDSFAMALASSLSRDGGAPTADGEDGEDKDRDVWRPDGKGRRGLEEDYDYVMYGKVRLCFCVRKGMNLLIASTGI
jgi:DNA-directed RNA polymerase I, II, and III subunit RPABC3